MDFEISYADHTNLLQNPLATIIDLTELPEYEANVLLREWQAERAKVLLNVRIEQELARIDPFLVQTAQTGFQIENINLIRDAFRNNSLEENYLEFMGIVLVPSEEGILKYGTIISPKKNLEYHPYAAISYISFPMIDLNEEDKNLYKIIKHGLSEMIFLSAHEFAHNIDESAQGMDNPAFCAGEDGLRAAVLTAITANVDFQNHMMQLYAKTDQSIRQLTDKDLRHNLGSFLNMNAGYALHPELGMVQTPLEIPSDQPWNYATPTSLESYNEFLVDRGSTFSVKAAETLTKKNFTPPIRLPIYRKPGVDCAWRRLAGPAGAQPL